MFASLQKGILKNPALEALHLSSSHPGIDSSEAHNFLRNRLRAKTLQSSEPSRLDILYAIHYMLYAIDCIHYIFATATMPIIYTICSMCTLHTTYIIYTMYIHLHPM